MKTTLKYVTLATAMLAFGCGGSDDDFNIPINPIPTPSSTTAFVQAGGSGNGSSQANPAPTIAAAQAFLNSNATAGQPTLIRVLPGGTLNEDFVLAANQTLDGVDGSPVLSGFGTLANGSKVNGLTFANSAVTSLVAPQVSDVSVTNVTFNNPGVSALVLIRVSGTVTVQNCVFNGGEDVVLFAQGGPENLQATLGNCTFDSATGDAIGMDFSSGATGNVTVDGATITNLTGGGGTARAVRFYTNDAGTNVNCQLLNSRIDNTNFGLDNFTLSGSQAVVLCINNLISNTTSQGISISVGDSGSRLLTRLTNNTLQNNQPGSSTLLSSGTAGFLGLVASGNNAATYQFSNDDPSAVTQIEDFGSGGANFSSRNPGALDITGTITDVPSGSLNIP